MSMSTHVVGLRPPTEEYLKKVKAWEACDAAEVEIPQELQDYFNGERPEPTGMLVEIEKSPAITLHRARGSAGFEVDTTKLPEGVTIVRFYNSW